MKKRWIVWLIIFVIFLLFSFWSWTVGKHFYHLLEVRKEVKALMLSDLTTIEPAYAFGLLHSVEADLDVIDSNIHFIYPVLPLFGQMPKQVQPSIIYLRALVDFSLLFEAKVTPILDGSIENRVDMADLVDGFVNDDQFIQQVIDFSQRIPELRQQVEISALPLRFQDDFLLLDKALPLISLTGTILPNIGDVIGADSAVKYLLLALNHDELRAGGGFITAIGVLSVQNLTNIDFNLTDSYQVDDLSKDYPAPPQPMATYMLAGYWLARDGNWAADFPVSAQSVQDLYQISRDDKTQGVIAFDQEAVRQILESTGTLLVDPQQKIWVDKDNVINYMQESWGSNAEQSDWWQNRKDFISVLGRVILKTIMDTRDFNQGINLIKVCLQLLDQGHLLVYFNNAQFQGVLEKQHLDHAVSYQGGDFLYWVDSNIGFNKVDAVVERQLHYSIDLSNADRVVGKISMQYEHTLSLPVECKHIATYGDEIAYSKMMERCYWDYWRLYLPPGSSFISAQVVDIPGNWLLNGKDWLGELDTISDLVNLNMLAGLMVLPAGSSQQIVLEYALPNSILVWQNGLVYYHLDLEKQLGLNALEVNIEIRLPQDATFRDFPEGTQVLHNQANYSTILKSAENHFMFSYQP